jgi:hypothetical protein
MTAPPPNLAELAAVAAFAPHLAQAFATLACDLALVIDAQGTIQRVVHNQARSLAEASSGWVGRRLVDTVTPDTRHKIERLLLELSQEGLARRREVNLPVPAGADIPVAYTALRLGPTGPALAVGHDLRSVARIQQRFLLVQQELERGYGLALRQAARGLPASGVAPIEGPAAPGEPANSELILGSEPPPGSPMDEQLNEASRAAFAAWLRAERLAGEVTPPPGPAPSQPPAGPPGQPPRRRRRQG